VRIYDSLMACGVSPTQLRMEYIDTEPKVARNPPKNRCRRRLEFFLWITLLIGLTLVIVFLCREYLATVLRWHQKLDGWLNVTVYIGLFFAVCLPFLFGYVIVCVGAGYIYGIWYGLLISSLATLFGCTIVFALCRGRFKRWAERKAAGYPIFYSMCGILAEPGRDGLQMLLLLRLSPIPVGMTTTLFAVSDMVWSRMMGGTFLGMLPTQILYVVVGSTLPSLDDVVEGKFNPYVIGIEVGLMLLITWYIGYTVQRTLSKAAKEYESGMAPLLPQKNDEIDSVPFLDTILELPKDPNQSSIRAMYVPDASKPNEFNEALGDALFGQPNQMSPARDIPQEIKIYGTGNGFDATA